MIEVGLVGFGLGGRAFHAPIIHQVPGMRIAAILQRNGNASEQFYPEAKIVRDLEELLAMPRISLVAIATPNDTHFPYAQRCLQAGRHVVVDKPFTNTLAEARELVALANKAGKVLTVYQDRRYDGDFRTVRKMIAEGTLGKITGFRTAFDRFRPSINKKTWKEQQAPGSGVFYDLGPHLLDQALQLFQTPQLVLADIRMEREGSTTADAFDVTFYYPDGLKAQMNASTLAPDPRPHYRVQGTKGLFVKQGLDPQEAQLRADQPAVGETWGMESPEEWGTLTLWKGTEVHSEKLPTLRGDYRDFYAQVRDAIEGRGAAPVTLDQALQLMYALELCVESSQKRAPLPWAFSGA